MSGKFWTEHNHAWYRLIKLGWPALVVMGGIVTTLVQAGWIHVPAKASDLSDTRKLVHENAKAIKRLTETTQELNAKAREQVIINRGNKGSLERIDKNVDRLIQHLMNGNNVRRLP